jgi:hypothetical protein
MTQLRKAVLTECLRQLEAIEAAPVLYQSALQFSSDRLTRRSSRVTNLLCRAESPHER